MKEKAKGKARAWFVKFPSAVYANGPVRFDSAITAQEFRAWVREWLSGPIAGQQVKRLSVGTQVWPTK